MHTLLLPVMVPGNAVTVTDAVVALAWQPFISVTVAV
jgi:hypothetical protein